MLKVLIVDDEPVIKEGLCGFSWDKTGFELVGAAEDGEEALLMVKLLAPDLVITDIKMPGMDGLTLAARIKEDYPFIHIILLTGHNETELVKSALKLHVDDYLLKPTDFNVLKKVLHKTAKSIHTRRSRQEQFDKMNKQLSTALPVLKSSLFIELVNGRFYTEKEAFSWFQLFEIHTGNYMVVTTSFRLKEEYNPENTKENWLVSMSISNICSEIFSNFTKDILQYFEHPNLYFLLIFSSDIEDKDCIQAAQYATKKIQTSVRDLLDAKISFGISSIGKKLNTIYTLYKQSQVAYNHSFFFGSNMTILFSDIEESTEMTYMFPPGKQELFDHAVRRGDIHQVTFILNGLWKDLEHTPTRNINQVKNIIITMILKAFQTIHENLPAEHDSMGWIQKVLDCQTEKDLMDYSHRLLESVIIDSHHQSQSHYDTIAKQIIQYIHEHYAEDLSLDILADIFHFSTSYVSRLIRKSSGINFTEILTDTRMSHAKTLLQQGHYKASEVGNLVGYKDPSYFIQLFKKRYGITPNEYKNMMKLSLNE